MRKLTIIPNVAILQAYRICFKKILSFSFRHGYNGLQLIVNFLEQGLNFMKGVPFELTYDE